MSKIKIDFSLKSKGTFLRLIHKTVGGELRSESELYFPPEHPVVSGTLLIKKVHDGLDVFISRELVLRTTVELERFGEPNSELILVNCMVSDAPLYQKTDDGIHLIFRLNEGLFFNTSNVNYFQELPVGQPFSYLVMIYNREWYQKHLKPQPNDPVHGFIYSKKTLLFYDTVSTEMLKLAHGIIHHNTYDVITKIEFELKALTFSLMAWRKVINRKEFPDWVSLNPKDFEAIVQVRQILIDNCANPPTILQLAKHAAMSESKLKVHFKQIFGDSIYQYCLKYRMEQAYQLLLKREMTVKDISDQLGYTNQSQFTKKFKDFYDCLPNELRKNL